MFTSKAVLLFFTKKSIVKIQNSKYLLLFFSIGIFLFFYYGLNFDGLYGQDAYEYLRYSKAIKNFLVTGENPGNNIWPPIYPIFGALLSFITQKVDLALLLISIFSLSISALYLYKIINILFSKSKYATLFVLVFFLLSPTILRSGIIIMSDILALCFIVLVVYHFIMYKQNKHIKYFYYITVFSVLAFLTRYVSALILLPFILNALVLFIKQKNSLKHLVFIPVIVFVLLLPHILIRLHNPIEFLSHQWLQHWSFNNFFQNNFSKEEGTFSYFLPNIIYAFSNIFSPKYLFVGIIFIPFFNRFKFKNKNIIFISLLLYALFLAGIPYQNNRFLMLTFPFILILCYPVFIYLSNYKFLKKLFYFGIFLIIIFQFFLIFKILENTLQRNKLEIEMAELLEPYQGNILYSFDIDIALQGRGLKFEYKNLWRKRYFNVENEALVLFHPSKFKKQWKDENPILNFNYLQENYNLKIIENYSEGWILYKIGFKNKFNDN